MGSARTAVTPENFVPAHGRLSTGDIDSEPPDERLRHARAGATATRADCAKILGYSIAAIIAIAAGGWFALHLSSGHGNTPPAASASPEAAPATSTPTVAIARNMQITVKGADLAAALNRDQTSVRKVFDDNRDAVLDTYKRALEGDSTLRDRAWSCGCTGGPTAACVADRW